MLSVTGLVFWPGSRIHIASIEASNPTSENEHGTAVRPVGYDETTVVKSDYCAGYRGDHIRPDFRIAALNANGLGAKESELSKELEAPMQRSRVWDTEAEIVMSRIVNLSGNGDLRASLFA